MCAALLGVSSCRRRKKKGRRRSRSKLQDHIRREISAGPLAGSKRRFFFFFFFVTNSSLRGCHSHRDPPLHSRPSSSPQSRGCPVQLVGLCASMFPSLLSTGRRTCTTAQFAYMPACLNASTFVAEVDLFCRALASGPPPLCLGRARCKDRIVFARRSLPCVMTRHAALCAGKLRMRQGARAASWR